MPKLYFSNDPFGANRAMATEIVRQLLEAWTPETKARIIAQMNARQAGLVEHVTIEDYDLALWHYRTLDLYAVSLNSEQADPTTPEGQTHHPKAQFLKFGRVAAQLLEWTRKYGKLLIGSVDPEKTAQYKRLLSNWFLIATWTEYPSAGFFILPD